MEMPAIVASCLRSYGVLSDFDIHRISSPGMFLVSERAWHDIDNGKTVVDLVKKLWKTDFREDLTLISQHHKIKNRSKNYNWSVLIPLLEAHNVRVDERKIFHESDISNTEIIQVLLSICMDCPLDEKPGLMPSTDFNLRFIVQFLSFQDFVFLCRIEAHRSSNPCSHLSWQSS